MDPPLDLTTSNTALRAEFIPVRIAIEWRGQQASRDGGSPDM
ncbi:MAG TPA: hypothetical protein VKB79_28135 [Bryobacteraceae bacterium]|nr:hypothetical protein [Bryobacteraceae bacterium]